VLERLHKRGYIDDPKNKAKSVLLTEEGKQRSRELFARYFSAEAK
jgi:Mn-dependent DtxR family transcriptional regulator